MKTLTNLNILSGTQFKERVAALRWPPVTLKLFRAPAVILQIVPKTAHDMYEYI
jgi:hypothetical protein